MNSCCLILLALLLPMQRWNATVTGHILDHEGKPLAGATVTYTNVGIFDRVDQRIKEGTGQVYKIKTDKQGRFELLGMQFGIYQIEVTAPDGSTKSRQTNRGVLNCWTFNSAFTRAR